MKTNDDISLILREIKDVAAAIDESQVAGLLLAIADASTSRVFLAGYGRSGLMARAFAMRLMHLGREVYVVGETVTPAIGKDDLLIVCSGSGDKPNLCLFAEQAQEAGASVAAITATPGSPLAKLATKKVILPVTATAQFGGSLFEQALLVLFDSIVMGLIGLLGTDHVRMKAKHANLE